MREALKRAVEVAGSQAELARRLAVLTSRPIRQGHVWKWLQSGRIAAEMAIPIERATDGKVLRHELRPDLYPLDTDTNEAAAVTHPEDGYRNRGVPDGPPPCDEAAREAST